MKYEIYLGAAEQVGWVQVGVAFVNKANVAEPEGEKISILSAAKKQTEREQWESEKEISFSLH